MLKRKRNDKTPINDIIEKSDDDNSNTNLKNPKLQDNLQPAQNTNSNETVARTENEDKHRQNSKNINDK